MRFVLTPSLDDTTLRIATARDTKWVWGKKKWICALYCMGFSNDFKSAHDHFNWPKTYAKECVPLRSRCNISLLHRKRSSRKYTRPNAEKNIHTTKTLRLSHMVTCQNFVNAWTVCAQQEISMTSL